MKTDKFSDRVDVTTTIALYEYGIIRNPKTDKCIICSNTHQLNHGQLGETPIKPEIRTEYITFDDVKEGLEEINEGYFDYIGSDKKTELDELNNNYLTQHIISLDQYGGIFELSR